MITLKKETQAQINKRVRSQASTDAWITVAWLNNEKNGTPAYQRILTIRKELEPLQSVFQALQSGRTISKRQKESIHHLKQKLKFKRYTYVADIGDSPLAAGFQMVPKDAAKVKRKSIACCVTDRLVAIGPASPELEVEGESVSFLVTEALVVAALGHLANQFELSQVRLCEQCRERWLVSERKIHRFCSDKCRVAFHQKSPEFKEKSARNQRRYRERLKQRKNQFS